MKRIALFVLAIVFASNYYGQASWGSGTNKLFTNSTTKVGIGVSDPHQELDVNGDVNIINSQLIGKQLSFGTTSDNVGIFFTPGTSSYPPTLYFRGANGEGPRDAFPTGEPYTGDPAPAMNCQGTDFQYSFLGALTVKGSGSHTGNLIAKHDGTDGFIETQGTGLGGSTHQGDLFINKSCNRNVFVFNNYTNFVPGFNRVMSVDGFLNVAENVQIGGNSLTSFSQLGTQLYVDAVAKSTGIKVKHAYNSGSGAGLMTSESYDSDWGLAVYKSTFSSETQRFGVQGDGKTWISTTNSEALVIVDAASPSAINFKVNKNGSTEINTSTADAFVVKDASNSGKINFKVKNTGFAYAREINVMPTNITFPDYVFDKNYPLISIDEVAEFIKVNKHLPNIPCAKEVSNNGINIGEMQIKQMEKIEEAFLYIIQLKKENDDLKARLQKLESIKQ